MRVRNNVCPTNGSPRQRGTKHFSYNFSTCTNPFIHLLGSSSIQWIIVRINEREEPKQNFQVRLGEAMLCLGGEVRLGGALLRLGRPESSTNLGSGSSKRSSTPRRALLRLGVGVSG